MRVSVRTATEDDAAAIAAVRTRAADRLTQEFGRGGWSWGASDRAVLGDIKRSRVLVALDRGEVLGSLTLQTAKPWAIDGSYFVPVDVALYLIDMAVDPDVQRHGVGRFLLGEAAAMAKAWPAQAIRLDAYDDAAGAGPFYIKCGYTEVGRVVYRGNPLVYFELLLQ